MDLAALATGGDPARAGGLPALLAEARIGERPVAAREGGGARYAVTHVRYRLDPAVRTRRGSRGP
jgi:hypothetical protein